MAASRPAPARVSLALKRLLDVVVAGVALLVLSPLAALIAIRIKLDSPGSVLYLSDRIGRDGRPFRLCKFRTMHREACRGPAYGAEAAERLFEEIQRRPEFRRSHKLREDPRVTRFGRWLRRTSFDELPQLVNVLRGELSLVGPRPVMDYEVQKLEQIARGEMSSGADVVSLSPWRLQGYWQLDTFRPGLTGYWQVTARSHVSYEERLRLDAAYMTSWSFKVDLLIGARTIGALAARGGD